MKITNHVYGGKVDLIFDTFKHQYSVDGEIIPGVTTVLGVLSKPQLMYWAANCAADYFKENIKPGVALDELEIDSLWQRAKKAHTQKKTDAGSLGSFVHHWVEDYINGKKPEMPINADMRGAVERFLEWEKKHQVKFLLSEQPIYSQSKRYAGTTDFICQIDGKMWLGDLKTSNAVYSEYISQASAYLNARVEEFPSEVYAGAVIVRVGKEDGEVEVVTKDYNELYPYYDLFISCLSTYNALKKVESISGKV